MKKLLALILLLPSLALADTVIETKTKTINVDLTISTSAYASGDIVGGEFTISDALSPGAFSGILQSVVLSDDDAEGANMKLVIFRDNPSSLGADNAAFDPTDADLELIACVVELNSHHAFSDNGATVATNVGCAIDADTATTLYGALVADSTPTYTATTDLSLNLTFMRD